MRVALVSEDEGKRREEGFREGLRPLLENFDRIYAEAKEEMLAWYERIKKFDFDHASWFQLRESVRDVEAMELRWKEHHMYFGCGVGTIYMLFEELCKELVEIDDTDPRFQALTTGFDNRMLQTDRRLFQLSRRAVELGFEQLFLTAKPEEVLPKLEQSEAGRQWVRELRDFLETDGWRMPLFGEYMVPTWKEDPTPAIVHIQQFMAKGPAFVLDETIKAKAKEREQAEKEILSRVPEDKKDWFTALLRTAQRFGWWQEDHSFYFDNYCWSIARYAFLQIGKRLAQAGSIENANDIFFLAPPEEIQKLLHDPWAYSAKNIVKRRRERWEEAKKVMPPPIILNEGVAPEEAMGLVVKSREPMVVAVAIGKMPKVTREELKADFVGVAGSPGVVEGPARVLFSPEQLREIQPGEILVAPGTYTAWTPIFSLIKGAVVDRGGTMSHSCIIGREYGIPVVINVIDASSKIKTGQRIKVDGNQGAVWILE